MKRINQSFCLFLVLVLINSCKEDEPIKPWNTTWAASNITTISATLNGAVNANQLATTVSFEYGTTSDYGTTVAATPNNVTGQWDVNVSADITNLAPATTYHFRIKSENSKVAVYGNDVTMKTAPGIPPSAFTLNQTNLRPSEVTVYGTVNPNLAPTTVTFEYGTTTNYGKSVTPANNSFAGNKDLEVSATIPDLTFGLTYHFRIKADNQFGSTVGEDFTFLPFYSIGSPFQGGLLAYIFQPGDPGYVDYHPHGLIVAPTEVADQGPNYYFSSWCLFGHEKKTGASEMTIGSGQEIQTKLLQHMGRIRLPQVYVKTSC